MSMSGFRNMSKIFFFFWEGRGVGGEEERGNNMAFLFHMVRLDSRSSYLITHR